MINTIYGEMDESTLERRAGAFENANEFTTWVEYYKDTELVHRSATVNLKEGFASNCLAGQLGG